MESREPVRVLAALVLVSSIAMFSYALGRQQGRCDGVEGTYEQLNRLRGIVWEQVDRQIQADAREAARAAGADPKVCSSAGAGTDADVVVPVPASP